ncbi:MAG: hypothetical protein K2G32_02130 [Oscillospiraceae bacterium]|nr:hypothetical protein [Oscillospiraceae bacterium]
MGLFKKKEEHHSFDPLRLVLESIRDGVETKAEIDGDTVYCPEWNIRVIPQVEQLTDNSAVLNFYLKNPEWDEPLFECSVGMGRDTRTAIGMACASFEFAFMQGIAQMQNRSDFEALESSFGGNTHRWKAYRSNIVGMGESPWDISEKPSVYWELLKKHIIKRLGNQKMCYVKIYAAKTPSDVTGECRIDDVKSEELSRLVADFIKDWDVKNFASHKQFFFIRQDNDTLLPNPYSGETGRNLLMNRVKTAIDKFVEANATGEYDKTSDNIKQAIDDPVLAEECYMFIPEICAENAFSAASYEEYVMLGAPEGNAPHVYKNQLADFYPIHNAIFTLFDNGVYGDQTNEVYKILIGASAICGSVNKLLENGGKVEDARLTALCFMTSQEFKLR